MFTKIDQFTAAWTGEMAGTLKILGALTDESLNRPDHKDVRTLGRAAWHIVTTYPEMCGRIGISIDGPTEKDPIPTRAADIVDAYRKAAGIVLATVSGWADADLTREDDMYGETWKRGKSLMVFLAHEIHHRAQMTVLMRLAGVPVPGIYGPSREEWTNYGMDTPAL